MTISEFNLIQSLVVDKIDNGQMPNDAFEDVKDMVFPRKPQS